MNKLVETYCGVDDFCHLFIPHWQRILLENGDNKRDRACRQLNPYFPDLLSYTRFLALMPSVVVPMCSYLTSKLGKPTGIQFVDSTKIEVCHIIRAKRNKVFEGIAQHGKGTMGWSFGSII